MSMVQVLPLQFVLYYHTVLMLQIVESIMHEAASSKSAQECYKYVTKAASLGFLKKITSGETMVLHPAEVHSVICNRNKTFI